MLHLYQCRLFLLTGINGRSWSGLSYVYHTGSGTGRGLIALIGLALHFLCSSLSPPLLLLSLGHSVLYSFCLFLHRAGFYRVKRLLHRGSGLHFFVGHSHNKRPVLLYPLALIYRSRWLRKVLLFRPW